MKHIQIAVVALLAAGIASAQSPESSMLRDTLRFGGFEWYIKDSGERRVGPGPNQFSAENVRIDGEGQLHLRATAREGGCVAAEVVALPSLGYGTYEFTVASNLDNLAKNLVLGLFTWDDTSKESFHREMDVEIGRWGREENADAQMVIQPYSIKRNIVRFRLTRGLSGSIHRFVWEPGQTSFRTEGLSVSGEYSVVQEHIFDHMIPEPGREQARINLWCMDSKAPADGLSEVVLSNFRFTPPR